ncbi:MAG TPA: hypothetical protein VIS71_09700 [Terrimicrobium sp.]
MDAVKMLRLAAFAMATPLAGMMAQQASPTPDQVRRGIWRAELPGGEYIVLLSAITSVSLHEYVVDGAARVAEVNVSTSGSQLARFYFIEPNPPKAPVPAGQTVLSAIESKANSVRARVETDEIRAKVVKSYPTSTHAHTVEYRLVDRESLNKLFDSVEEAWLSGRAGSFKP